MGMLGLERMFKDWENVPVVCGIIANSSNSTTSSANAVVVGARAHAHIKFNLNTG